MKSREYLAHVKSLLDIEKQEDLAQYKRMVLDRSLKERVKKGTTWHPVAMQRMYIGMGEKLIVEVQKSGGKEQPHAFQPGGLVSVFGMLSDQEVGRARGVIASVRQKTMRVALSMETIPDWLTKSSLGVDLEFDDKTYQEMNRAIESMRDPGKNEDLATLREKMLGDGKPEFHKWDYTYHNATLNASQNEAVQKALEAREVAIIHGPPGTGKTTTLVEVIKETVHRESQVLVCAPSNTAVDLLTLKCWQAGMNVVRMGNPVRVDEALQELTLDGSIQAHEDYAALRKVRKEAEEVRRQAHKYKRNFGPEERRKRGEKMKEARELKAMAHQLEDYILFQVLQRAQVITATLIGAANQHLRKRDFTTVFIDEAGQALLPSSLIPLQYAKRVIMAGDHRQLPPTVKSFEADKQGLSETLFERVIEKKPEVSVMLREQYRMNEQIMTFSGQQFYDGNLTAHPSVRFWQLGNNFPPVEFIDTAGCGFEEKKHQETLSTFNPEEANLLLRHLAILFNQITDEEPDLLEQQLSVGIIAPYKAQVETLKRQLRNSPMLSDYQQFLTINTVDGFQGQERDVMYISLTRSNGKNEIGFLKDVRRMNVALTRARKKLVVVGDSATLGKHPFYEAFLSYIEEIGSYRSAWELLADG